ncbi:MAG TPA: Rieske 2Fe-2S domain-containing protein [Methylomirabilota bacterium]|jgi:phenylpropionate dioxygenase-like ring-hydroxylating dioxygenase large terminal subunit
MLSARENDLLTLTGPGTPMGDLLRRYWIPVVLAGEVVAGGRVKRVQLLGERLVVHRTPSGRPGVIAEFCPHRGASLYFGRNEEGGMRCVYHGWKFALDGQCVDMPSEPADSSFASKVCHTAYPCAERGGVIWAWMGPGAAPPLPDLEWTLLPADHVFASKRVQDCNWFQAMEGGIDSSHISFLHAPIDHTDRGIADDMDRASFGVGAAVQTGDRAPRFDVVDTDYGALIGARRTQPDGCWHWRVTQYLLPFHTMPPVGVGEKVVQSHIWVPMDDTHVVNWMVTWHVERPLTREEIALHIEGKGAHVCDYAPATPEPYGDVRTVASRDNDYFMDWDVHRTTMFCGIPGFGVQDQAIQESQGPRVDRSQERLGSSDTAIIQVRRRLMTAARALRERGEPAPGGDPRSFCVRSASVVLPAGADWLAAARPLVLVRDDQTLTLA